MAGRSPDASRGRSTSGASTPHTAGSDALAVDGIVGARGIVGPVWPEDGLRGSTEPIVLGDQEPVSGFGDLKVRGVVGGELVLLGEGPGSPDVLGVGLDEDDAVEEELDEVGSVLAGVAERLGMLPVDDVRGLPGQEGGGGEAVPLGQRGEDLPGALGPRLPLLVGGTLQQGAGV